jgi:Flp pilus assembly protein TadD
LALALGNQLLNQKRFAEAQKELETAVTESKGELPEARWRLALVLIQAGDGAGALELLAPLEEAFPKEYEVVAGLGFAHHLQKNFHKALGYLEQAMTLRPPDTLLLNVLGDCYQKTGDTEQARNNFERSLKLNPDQELIKNLLAVLGDEK